MCLLEARGGLSHDAIVTQTRRFSTAGWTLTGLCAVLFLGSAGVKLFAPAEVRATAAQTFGFPEHTLPWLALLELGCLALYLLPRTAVFGAVLVTAYLGGAVATHARVGDPALLMPVVIGVGVWLGLYLREPRLRALTPLVQPPSATTGASANR